MASHATTTGQEAAVEHELERDALADYLEDLDVEFGAVPAELVEDYDARWP
jgi:hypothetical protein